MMTMRLLFAITIGCFCAFLWIALALARRIHLSQLLQPRPVRRPNPTQEFFEAGEYRTPRPLRLEQEILQQKPRLPLSEITFVPQRQAPVANVSKVANVTHADTPIRHAPEPISIRSAPAYATLFGAKVPIERIDSQLRPDAANPLTPTSEVATVNSVSISPPVPFSLHRRPPQPSRQSGLRRRIDLSQYNTTDMGDLTDPYTHPLRGSGTQGPVPGNRCGQ